MTEEGHPRFGRIQTILAKNVGSGSRRGPRIDQRRLYYGKTILRSRHVTARFIVNQGNARQSVEIAGIFSKLPLQRIENAFVDLNADDSLLTEAQRRQNIAAA